MKKTSFTTALLFIISFSALAQHPESGGEATAPSHPLPMQADDSLKRVLHDHGEFQAHFRSYFLNTINEGSHSDYYALATGGGLSYHSPVIKNFQVGVSGFIIYNVFSSDLALENGLTNRYELALFDITDPHNRKDLDRMEDLYLKYYLNSAGRSFAQLGRFHVTTPLLNPQDTRMRPNVQEGLWVELKEWDNLKFRGGWLWSTSPRSTVEWYGIGESVGIYGSGSATNGEPAEYAGHIKSKRILVGNLEWTPVKNIHYQLWDYQADNLFNIVLQKAEIKKQSVHNLWMAGIQYLWQRSQSDDRLPVANQYIAPDEQSHVLSGRIAVSGNSHAREWSLNYTRITSHGRFLFPREWGTETLYTYSSRERSEGAGDVHALMLEHGRYLDKQHRVLLRGRAGIYEMPAIDDARLNKYGMPSYYHLTLQGNYKFKGFFKGLESQLLYIYKGNLDSSLEAPPVVLHNKTEMHHIAVRVDYYF